MLVLSRKLGEKIIVNDDIVITLVEIVHGEKVRLGIDAPEHVAIWREELWKEKLERNNQNQVTE